MNLFVKTFRLIGIEKDYEVNFRKGLNFISGPTSTGKTTIFELINYAFGGKTHKNYIEVGSRATDVEVEFVINGIQYRIKRTLFKFELPILVEVYDEETKKFEILRTFLPDNKEYEKTISAFLLSKLGLDGVKVVNQNFSFRDLFKFSYLKQTKIDDENILEANVWAKYAKQKATFEIIFNIYDQLIGELKSQVKHKQEEINEEKIKLHGVSDFLKHSEVENFESVDLRKKEIEVQANELNKLLNEKKEQIRDESSDTMARQLSDKILEKKQNRTATVTELENQNHYIRNLITLSNQYSNDVEKIDAAIMGVREINKYDFLLCPNCLQPLESHAKDSNCLLCNRSMETVAEEILMLKNERKSINTKLKELNQHITQSLEVRDSISMTEEKLSISISSDEKLLDELTDNYVNPFVEEISLINLSLGKLYSEKEELDSSLRFIKELNRLNLVLKDKMNDLDDLKNQIEEQKDLNEKDDVFKGLNEKFTEILEKFKFPKLSKSYIDPSKYLPYVRDRKYDDLGSLGAVTLLTVAFYLTILEEASKPEINSNHLNILMIDTPSKNLGVSAKSSEFQDEEIFDSMIRYFIDLDERMADELQLFVINNGYPEFLPAKYLIKEFSSDGHSGLIDDI